ncbi:MAG: hypothetical protein AAFR64_01005 [Pseudomonadota bacterium]
MPPNQHFTSQLLVGVIGFANANGTLVGGLDRVRFHFEGSVTDIIEPSFYTLTRVDGSRYKCLGYWVTLDRPANLTGEAHLYAEGIPADAMMQSRVIGPYSFSLVEQLHDHELTVAPSQQPIEGSLYQSVGAALDYLRNQNAQNPHITIAEAMTEDLSVTVPGGPAHVGSGYCTITASAPVTFSRPAYTDDPTSLFRTKYNRLHFKGANITFDMHNVSEVWTETSVEGEHWLDGCRFINSGGRADLWRKGLRPVSHLIRGYPWFTDCYFEGVSNPTVRAQLVRGCVAKDIYGDFSNDPQAAIYNSVTSLDATIDWLRDAPAMTVIYSGGEADATLELSGSNDAKTRTFTAEWGGQSSSFVVGDSEDRYLLSLAPDYDATIAGEGYTVADVATWLNSLPGWNATVLDNSRRASAFSLPNLKGTGFSPTNVKDITLELVTCFDVHGDFFQQIFLSENCVVAFNTATEMICQNIFVGSQLSPPLDFSIIGNAFANVISEERYGRVDQLATQFLRQPFGHLMYAHNTMPAQRIYLRTDLGFDPDSYCIVANNYHPGILWFGPSDSDLRIADNSIDQDQTMPEGAIGGFAAGTGLTKVQSFFSGNFLPAGELVSYPARPVFAYDANGAKRSDPDAIGAFAIPTD